MTSEYDKPSESSLPFPSVRDYLRTGTAAVNVILALFTFFIVWQFFPIRSIFSDSAILVWAFIFALGMFLNQWKAVIIALIAAYLTWLLLFSGALFWFSGMRTIHNIGMVVLMLVTYGFVLGRPGKVFFDERISRKISQNLGARGLIQALGVHEFLSIVGNKIYIQVNEYLPLGSLLPPFIDPKNEASMRINPGETRTSTASRGDAESIAPSAAVMAFPLYVVTLLIEIVGAVARSAIFGAVFLPLLWLILQNIGEIGDILGVAFILGMLFGFYPIILSLFHYFLPFFRTGAGAEAERFGARHPTRDEMENFIEAGVYIRERAQELGKIPASPGEWRVIDNNVSAESYTIGSTIYVTSYAVASEHLAGLVAHELGHLAHHDGDVILALRRLVIPFAYYFGIDRQPMPAGSIFATGGSALGAQQVITDDMKLYYRMKMLPLKLSMSFWFGGLGMFLMGRQWAKFWRHRDFRADEYAASIGLADDLMSVLEVYQHVDVAQPYLLTNRPYTAQRLDRLKG